MAPTEQIMAAEAEEEEEMPPEEDRWQEGSAAQELSMSFGGQAQFHHLFLRQ
jgi:hypothetical protein